MIKYLDYYIPEYRLSLEVIFQDATEKGNLHSAFKTADEGIQFFQQTINLQTVSYAGRMKVIDMLDVLLNRFLECKIVNNTEVQLIILIADDLARSERPPNLAQYIQHTYGFSGADLLVLSGNHCANIEHAVVLGEKLLKSGTVNNILILNANKYDRNDERIVGTYAVHGDGAGIVFLNNDQKDGIVVKGSYSYTNGILHKADMEQNSSLVLCKNYLACLSGFVKKYSLSNKHAVTILVPNANCALIGQCLNSLGFKTEQLFVENIDKYGHLDAVDFIINLKSFVSKKHADGASFFSFGTGWAGSNICLYLQTV